MPCHSYLYVTADKFYTEPAKSLQKFHKKSDLIFLAAQYMELSVLAHQFFAESTLLLQNFTNPFAGKCDYRTLVTLGLAHQNGCCNFLSTPSR